MKEAIFHPQALDSLRSLPDEARRALGKAIWDLQLGLSLEMPLSKPMPSVGLGVSELRLRDRNGIYRAFYYTKSAKGILVLHVFDKKTQRTPPQEIEMGRRRLKEMLYEKKD